MALEIDERLTVAGAGDLRGLLGVGGEVVDVEGWRVHVSLKVIIEDVRDSTTYQQQGYSLAPNWPFPFHP